MSVGSVLICGVAMVNALLSAEVPSTAACIDRAPVHGVYVVAHRGAHEGIPENTLAAYRKAIALGCDFVEIDVRTTKDDKFVSVHNASVDGYCVDGTTGKVNDFTLAELKALDIGSRIGPEWKDERIPTFEEILDLCKGKIGIYLDLKSADVPTLVNIIKEKGMTRDVIWYASYKELEQVASVCDDCVPMPDPGVEKRLRKLIERFEPCVIAAAWRGYSENFVKICHDADALVIVDEDTPDCWADALAWGSDGIQTDHPAALVEYLKSATAK